MRADDRSSATWRKSSRSSSNASCVELAGTHDRVRDSKNPDGPVLTVPVRELLAAVRAGQLGG